MSPGLFGDLFDLDHDGRLDSSEEAMELGFLSMMEKDRLNGHLEQNGIDPDQFENMSGEERVNALSDAGLDPGEYQDYDILF